MSKRRKTGKGKNKGGGTVSSTTGDIDPMYPWGGDQQSLGLTGGYATDQELDGQYPGGTNVTQFPAGGKTSAGKSQPMKRCLHSHPALKVGEYEIYGGSGSTPAVEDCDVYVALDGYSGGSNAKLAYPWNKGMSFTFKITDMQPPGDHDEFVKLISWLAKKLKEGKKVHVGCIGGHGRTGTVFAALVKHMTGNKNATAYVRENYCKKAVESQAQLNYLNTKWEIEKVEPTKKSWGSGYSNYKSDKKAAKQGAGMGGDMGPWPGGHEELAWTPSGNRTIDAMESNADVWGVHATRID